MTAKLTVEVPTAVLSGSPQIPSVSAVIDDQGGFQVWVVDPTTLAVSARKVKLGNLSGESVEVQSGLEGSEWIAVSGVHQLREGMKISRLGS